MPTSTRASATTPRDGSTPRANAKTGGKSAKAAPKANAKAKVNVDEKLKRAKEKREALSPPGLTALSTKLCAVLANARY